MVFQFANNNLSDADVHLCEARREGDWVVFTCPHCADFERRLNFVTGQFHIQADGNPYILHEGTYQPVGFEVSGSGAN
jgi:hypothetical protein